MLNLIGRFALAILLAAILILVVSGNLLSASPFVIAGQVLAIAFSAWARRSFPAGQFSMNAEPKEGQRLSTGPYRFVRHPMYAAALVFIWSSILGHLSLFTGIIGLIVTGTVAVRVVVEETLLRATFPDYEDYSRKTKRIVPYIV